ncbi:MAG TPA: M50 family metallopeptidase [Thermoplasmata archaeon]|nr:M50 family metallopeptidase [Thermoplasmata archaeon]
MNPPNPFAYSWTQTPPAHRAAPARVTTSRTELLHLGVSFAVLTACFYLILSRNVLLGGGGGFPGGPLIQLPVAGVTALTGFVAHELAHKVTAQRRGYWAEFRASPYGLVFALIVSTTIGFLFAAPGATMVGGIPQNDEDGWGRTSIAGPATNAGFAAIFYGGAVLVELWTASALVVYSLLFLAYINAWFGTFNLIPFGALDGRKVYLWDRGRWAVAMSGMAAASVLTFLALYEYASPFLGR